MKKRTAAVLVALLVGLIVLWLAGRDHTSSAPETAATPAEAPAPARPAPTKRRPRPAIVSHDDDSGVIDGRVINGVTHEGIGNAELTFLGDRGASTFRTAEDGSFELVPTAGSMTLASISAPGFLPYGPRSGSRPRTSR